MKRTLAIDTKNKVGQKIKLAGWVNSYRNHGNVTFIDLRDRSGIVQLVFTKEIKKAPELRSEWVIEVEGEVKERMENNINEDLETGGVEVKASKLKILSEAETPPFSIKKDGYKVNEEVRLKHRYVDLRRQRLQKNLRQRAAVSTFIRNFLQEKDFTEIETPILTKSTPEGARDFIVPSRLEPGHFYALPQSPQQYKQLLMVAGFEKYFQLARCFRDEDLRADRQTEFTQLDIELSFSDQEEVLKMVEELMISIVEEFFPNKKIKEKPFPRLTYQEAIEEYNCDDPDLRENKDEDSLAFAFITDFPLFERKKDDSGWTSMHHPFTRPQTDNIKKIKNKPDQVKAFQYDLVLNGHEIGGGSLRIFKPEILKTIFKILGHSSEEVEEKFGHLLKAFQYGVPPHGGIALGLDRLLEVLLKEDNLREVIAFPKSSDARGLMMDTPASVDEEQLEELNLEIKKNNGANN